MLNAVQQYLQTRSVVSLGELAQALQVDQAVVREMIQLLVRKGRVKAVKGKECGGCHSCAPETLEFYQWVRQ
ncbi:MAG: FeoC-like transcriptional regulator [Pseudanabaenaceae cyanobacterium SKYGB_i_bin29]|nr:FeoC-like transcriptional regulator [Pseudanabaenaceae cyanobacterium SKYG29]MDW8422614.1 FeoC-like transcriptional regulator [Pseudanabaenaceae cyanobacterium SKYGB_i_bin29]